MNILRILLVTFIAILLVALWRMAPLLNLGHEPSMVAGSECRNVDGLVGAEDITIDQETGMAYIATDDRRSYLRTGGRASENGALWVKDLTQAGAMPVRVTANYPEVFHPHGISLFKDGDTSYLFVVNHPSTIEHQVDVFRMGEGATATLEESIRFPEMTSPNDLHAVSRKQFYITNDHKSPRQTAGEKIEDFFRLAKTNVLFYDNGVITEEITDLYMANGVITTPDQSALYVAESTGERISEYTNDGAQWTLQRHIELNVMPDNLEWASDGKLLVGSHPRALDFLVHTFDDTVEAPSIAHSIDLETGEHQVIYSEDGSSLSGSSVAATYQNQLLVGSVFEPHYVHCVQQRVVSN